MDLQEYETKVAAIESARSKLRSEKPYTASRFDAEYRPEGIENARPGTVFRGQEVAALPVDVDEALGMVGRLNDNFNLKEARDWTYSHEGVSRDFYNSSKNEWQAAGSPPRRRFDDPHASYTSVDQLQATTAFYDDRAPYFRWRFAREEIDAYREAYGAGFAGQVEVRKRYDQTVTQYTKVHTDERVVNYLRMVKLGPAVDVIKGKPMVGLPERSQWAMALLALDQIQRAYDPDYLVELVRADLIIVGEARDRDAASRQNAELNGKLNAVVQAAKALGYDDEADLYRQGAATAIKDGKR